MSHGSTLLAAERPLPLVSSITGGPGPLISQAALEWFPAEFWKGAYSLDSFSLTKCGTVLSPSAPF